MKGITEEQRRAENMAFMNEPCRFRQYINEDGTVGKTYNLPNGVVVKINDADFIPIFEESERKFREKCKEFHNKLILRGVKAYRHNDGWVDRVKCRVTFFASEKDMGAYWGSVNLQPGDKIYIGDWDGGRFARIVKEEYGFSNESKTYFYRPLQETLGNYKTRNNLTFWDKVKLFFDCLHLQTDIYNESR